MTAGILQPKSWIALLKKGFYTIGALKTNRILYPCGIRQKASAFALHLRKTDPNISLVTVDKRQFYVYRYEGNLNDVPNTVVLLSYPTPCLGFQSTADICFNECSIIHAGNPETLYPTLAN